MKLPVSLMFYVLSFLFFIQIEAVADSGNDSIAYKVASIDAGRRIASDDASIDRAEKLLSAISRKYEISEERAANMAATAKEELKKKNVYASLLDMLDGALIIYPINQDKKDEHALASFLALYDMLRIDGTMTHQEAIGYFISLLNSLKGASNIQQSKKGAKK